MNFCTNHKPKILMKIILFFSKPHLPVPSKNKCKFSLHYTHCFPSPTAAAPASDGYTDSAAANQRVASTPAVLG